MDTLEAPNDRSGRMTHIREILAGITRNSPQNPVDPAPTSRTVGSPRPFAQPIQEFMNSGPKTVEWIVPELIPRGGLVVLAARPKVGKSLLTFNLALGLSKGSFLGRDCVLGKTLIVQLEDPPALVRERLALMGPKGDLFVRAGLPLSGLDLERLPSFIKSRGIDLVIIDPLVFVTGGTDENDAGKMSQFLLKLRLIAHRTGSTILFVHHHRKSSGENGDAIRGSSAILAAVDVALELKRESESSPRARLSMTSRFGRMESEILTLDEETLTWHSHGTSQDYRHTNRESAILDALKASGEEMDCPALEHALDLKSPNFKKVLRHLITKGLVVERRESTGGRPRSYFSLPLSDQSD